MTLNLNKIEQAANDEKDAGEFAQLMRQFRALGVTKYDYLVAPGCYRFFDHETHIDIRLNGIPKKVATTSNATKIKDAVRQAQAGKIDFETFTELAGSAGVPYWTSDLVTKRVSYWNHNAFPLLVEPISGL